ncbi:MAG: DUF2520 domain-containing protein [Flavobacteriaceae bacterium]|nr:DUF2520 domain-containing protein [Bacteroidia bacterium]NNL61013.1 DUF2520 domain-containing protein [Flavobacteriaceae bacterium]RZV66131.1 MAG: DUF2520 domain-containing protein [Flavobacteriaceae bacterium]
MISVTLIGAGNVATHFYKAFRKAEETKVLQWYNRSLKSLQMHKNEVEITSDISTLKKADIYIICVSDDAVAEVSEQLPFKNRLVVHTSGSVNIHDLDKKNHRGVFYPLQTFSKEAEIDFSQVPICIEVLEKSTFPILKELAEIIGSKVHRINGDQRSALHLAAVFVNNFTNQLYRIAHEVTEEQSTDFNILKPLILETARKIETLSPYLAQTGPAKRNDKKTIKKHLSLLNNEMHKKVYELLTKSIQETHGKKL